MVEWLEKFWGMASQIMISLYHQLFHQCLTPSLYTASLSLEQTLKSELSVTLWYCCWLLFTCLNNIFGGSDCWLPCIGNNKSLYAISVLQAYKFVPDICHAVKGMFYNTSMKILQSAISYELCWICSHFNPFYMKGNHRLLSSIYKVMWLSLIENVWSIPLHYFVHISFSVLCQLWGTRPFVE